MSNGHSEFLPCGENDLPSLGWGSTPGRGVGSPCTEVAVSTTTSYMNWFHKTGGTGEYVPFYNYALVTCRRIEERPFESQG